MNINDTNPNIAIHPNSKKSSKAFKSFDSRVAVGSTAHYFPPTSVYQSSYSLGGSSFLSVDSRLPERSSATIPICYSLPSLAGEDVNDVLGPLKNTTGSHNSEIEDAFLQDSGLTWTASAVTENDSYQPDFSDSSSAIFSHSSIRDLSSSGDEKVESTSGKFKDLPASKGDFNTDINTLLNDGQDVQSHNKTIANWYQQSLIRSYRTKLSHFKRIFKDTPVDTNCLLVDYACALAKNKNGLLLQGRMYITEQWICFYSKIIYEQKIYLAVKNIVSVVKAKTARFIPNAIQISYLHNEERYFFTSFASRERTYAILKKVWENSKGQGRLLPSDAEGNMEEILCQVQDVYGDESLAVLEYEDGEEADEDLPYQNTRSDFSSSLDANKNTSCSPIGCDPNIYRLAMLRTSKSGERKRHQRSSRYQKKAHKTFHESSTSPPQDEGIARERSPTPYRSGPRATMAVGGMKCPSDSSGDMSDGDTSKESLVEGLFNHQLTTNDTKKTTVDPDSEDKGIVINFKENTQTIKTNRFRRRTQRRTRCHNSVSDSLEHGMTPATDTNQEAKENKEEFHEMGPVQCGEGHDHKARFYADTAVNLSVDALFAYLFTDSCFFADFCAHRSTFDVQQSSWPSRSQWPTNLPLPSETPDKEALFHRRISYTLTLKQRLGPRTCTAKEHQTILLKESIPGVKYIIDAKVTNEAVPLCNCFHVVSRYCLLRRSPTVSQLRISSEVVYDRPVFFGAKSIIESTCKTSLTDNFTSLITRISAAVAQLSDAQRRTGGPLARCHHTSSTKVPAHSCLSTKGDMGSMSVNNEHYRGNTASNMGGSGTSPGTLTDTIDGWKTSKNVADPQQKQHLFLYNDSHAPQTDRTWLFVIALGLLLCVCLSLVYNRCLQLEQMAYRMEFTDSIRNTESLQSQREFLLQQTLRLHQQLEGSSNTGCIEEINTAKMLIHSVSDVLTQMQFTLGLLQKRIEKLTPELCSPLQPYSAVLGS